MPHTARTGISPARVVLPSLAAVAGLMGISLWTSRLVIAQDTRPAATRPAPTLQQEYEQRFAGLAPKDLKGHYALAEWCHQNKLYRLAIRECDYILKLEPAHENAKLLRGIALRELGRGGEPTDDQEPGKPPTENAAAAEYLTPAQIQKLRFAELLDPPKDLLDLLDDATNPSPPPRRGRRPPPPKPETPVERESAQIRFSKDVRTDFLERMSGQNYFSGDEDHNRFLRLSPVRQFQLVRYYTANRYEKRIEILSDPVVFRDFRPVLPIVLNGCGTVACHGGPEAKVYRLRTGRPGSEANLYTNFVILNRIRTKSKERLINRGIPEDSIILQFGLPASYAKKAHPVEIPPLYLKGPEDPRYQTVLDWITSLRVPESRSGVSLPGFPELPPAGSAIGQSDTEEKKTAPAAPAK